MSTTGASGFNSSVALKITGLPAGVAAVFSPASIAAPGTGSSTLTLTATGKALRGSYAVTVTATAGSSSKSVQFTLNVPSLAATLSAASLALQRGADGSVAVSTEHRRRIRLGGQDCGGRPARRSHREGLIHRRAGSREGRHHLRGLVQRGHQVHHSHRHPHRRRNHLAPPTQPHRNRARGAQVYVAVWRAAREGQPLPAVGPLAFPRPRKLHRTGRQWTQSALT